MLVLLIDRDDDTRKMYAEYLKLGPWTIDEASDGPDALAKAIGRRPQIIVMETRLPGISGYDLCGILKRDAVTRAIPIVVVTADASAVNLQRAIAAGADAVLTKPCLPETLVNELRRLVHEGREQQRAGGGRGHAATPLARSEAPETADDPRRRALSRAHNRRDTTAPPVIPPVLICPECDQPLIYQRSHIGGVSARHAEQWDYFECTAGCGTFQYRERTRKLRKVR